MTARVMGLDVSITKTGYALPDGTTGVSKSSITKKHGDRRLANLYEEIYSLLVEHEVTHVITEDLPINGKGAGGTGQAVGAVRLALQQLGVPYVKVVPATLKKYATDSGRADKMDMHEALPPEVKRAIPIGSDTSGWDDRVDAWWLRHMGLNKLGQISDSWRVPPAVVKWEGWGL